MSINEETSTTYSPSGKSTNSRNINYSFHNLPNEKAKKKLSFSGEITIIFVESYKRYNKLAPIYHKEKKDEEKIRCNCLIY